MKYAKDYTTPQVNQDTFYLKGRYIFQYAENLKPTFKPFKYTKLTTMEYNWNPTEDDINCTKIYNIDENFYNKEINKTFINYFLIVKF